MTAARDAARAPRRPFRSRVLTGFLGAGKTTLLNRLLRDPALADTAVIINEFGEIGLDHLLVEQSTTTWCCCDAAACAAPCAAIWSTALERLLRNLDNGRASSRRVIIETTGLADPAPVLHTMMVHPYLVMRYRLDGVVTVVDAVNGAATLDAHAEAVKQVAVADRIVLTKTDLSQRPSRREASPDCSALRALNPAAPILDAAAGEAAPRASSTAASTILRRKIPDVKRWLAAEAYADQGAERTRSWHASATIRTAMMPISARSLSRPTRPIPAGAFEMFIDLVRSMHGPNLLRLKGMVKIAETPETPLVVHAVQHLMHPLARLERWPDGDHRTRIVFIVRDIDPRAISELFDAFLGAAAPDRPDRAAIADNPLVPFGGIDR